MAFALAWIAGPEHANVFLCDTGTSASAVVALKEVPPGSSVLILGDWRMQRPIIYPGSCMGEGLTADEVFATPSINVVDPPLPPEVLQRRRSVVRQFIDNTHGDMNRAEALWRLELGGTPPATVATAAAPTSPAPPPPAAAKGPARRTGRKR